MLSDVIASRGYCRFVHMYIQKGNGVLFIFCAMYEKYCLPTNCDNVVSCIKTLSMCRVPCVSVLSLLSYIT